jgi:hypothetical protein
MKGERERESTARVLYLGTAENDYRDAKYENDIRRLPHCRKRVRERKTCKMDLTPSKQPKMSPSAQNMKTEADAHGTAENESGSANHKNGRLRPPHRQKHVRERKT